MPEDASKILLFIMFLRKKPVGCVDFSSTCSNKTKTFVWTFVLMQKW